MESHHTIQRCLPHEIRATQKFTLIPGTLCSFLMAVHNKLCSFFSTKLCLNISPDKCIFTRVVRVSFTLYKYEPIPNHRNVIRNN